jgi:hypothetical protein
MNGLFPKEELAVERWMVLCQLSNDLCVERSIKLSEFYPNQHSKNSTEKTIGIALSNYRQGLSQKGTTCAYECVDYIIRQQGFGHWLIFMTDEEKALDKWKKRIDFVKERSKSLEIPNHLFYPCQRSECKEEREISIALNNYRQALSKKGTHHLYESVSELIQESMPHWFSMTSHVKILLEKWRKKWEMIKYICTQKKIEYSLFYHNQNKDNLVEKPILHSIHTYLEKQRYPQVDEFIRLFHPHLI